MHFILHLCIDYWRGNSPSLSIYENSATVKCYIIFKVAFLHLHLIMHINYMLIFQRFILNRALFSYWPIAREDITY